MAGRNPYAAPGAKVADGPPPKGSPYKAVGLGVLTDLGGTFALSMVLAFLYGVVLASGGMPAEDIEATLRSVGPDSWYFWVGSAGGCACSVLGGYVCARVAGQSEYTLGAILAVLVLVLGLVLFGAGGQEVGLSIVLHASTVVAVILGAWIGKKKNRAWRSPPPSTTSPSA